MFSILEKKMFKLLKAHEDETKLTWLAAAAPTGEEIMGRGGG